MLTVQNAAVTLNSLLTKLICVQGLRTNLTQFRSVVWGVSVHGAHDDAVGESLLSQRLCTHQTRWACGRIHLRRQRRSQIVDKSCRRIESTDLSQ